MGWHHSGVREVASELEYVSESEWMSLTEYLDFCTRVGIKTPLIGVPA